MAACYEPLVMTHTPATSSPQQAPVLSTVGLLYDSITNRTFRIPDVPATSSVGHIKSWYTKNVGGADPRTLVLLANGQPVDDSMQVWQLAQGTGQFEVSITQAQAQVSPRSILTVYVDTVLPVPPVALQISSDSTVLYVKQRILELIQQPMSLAACPETTLVLPPANSQLHNSRTLEECGVQSNARLSFSFAQPDYRPPAATLSPSQVEFSRIQQIWSAPTTAATPQSSFSQPPNQVLLPAALFDDEDEVRSNSSSYSSDSSYYSQNSKTKSRGSRRSQSPPGDSCQPCQGYTSDQLQHLAANFRTKMCRNGPICKFGKNCWFAHDGEELRKPSDPLPNNIPAVHKLERYSKRDAQDSKGRRSN